MPFLEYCPFHEGTNHLGWKKSNRCTTMRFDSKDGTIVSLGIIISIFGGKWKSWMTTKGISSGTFSNNGNNVSCFWNTLNQ